MQCLQPINVSASEVNDFRYNCATVSVYIICLCKGIFDICISYEGLGLRDDDLEQMRAMSRLMHVTQGILMFKDINFKAEI